MADVTHWFPGRHNADGTDTITGQITICCGLYALDMRLKGSYGTVDPAACTCPKYDAEAVGSALARAGTGRKRMNAGSGS